MSPLFLAAPVGIVLAMFAMPAPAQSLYRYLDADGRIVYSDKPPPPSAKDVQPKRLPQNVIETDPVPFAARDAAEKYPVTLYTFDCDVCKDAQALLVKRGVPFTTVIVSEQAGADKLKALTGKQAAPVLQVGEKNVMQGFNASRWQAMLDEAGYPANAPPPRQQAARPSSSASDPQDKAPVATSPAAKEQTPASPPTPGTDYPK